MLCLFSSFLFSPDGHVVAFLHADTFIVSSATSVCGGIVTVWRTRHPHELLLQTSKSTVSDIGWGREKLPIDVLITSF